MARGTHAQTIDGSKKVRLDDIDTAKTDGLDKEEGVARVEKLGRELSELENLLTYAGTHALLVVLQGRDASGKDGAIRKILEFSNIQNAYVHPFKVPTEEERAHDFLWRVHHAVPRRGYMALFNRSHYEDVLAARVHRMVPESIWKARYDHINAFEQLLVDADVIVLKFYLHISRDEQYERLRAREKDPAHGLEAQPGRLARAAAVGRVHSRLRGRLLPLRLPRGALVPGARGQEVVPEPGGHGAAGAGAAPLPERLARDAQADGEERDQGDPRAAGAGESALTPSPR